MLDNATVRLFSEETGSDNMDIQNNRIIKRQLDDNWEIRIWLKRDGNLVRVTGDLKFVSRTTNRNETRYESRISSSGDVQSLVDNMYDKLHSRYEEMETVDEKIDRVTPPWEHE